MSSTAEMWLGYLDDQAEARRMLRGLAAEAWRPRRPMPLDQWAERHRVLPAGSSSRPGPWRNDAAPYLAEVLRAISDPDVETVTLMTATQVGKTEALINFLLWAIDQDPGPTLLVYPNLDLGRTVMRDRIVPSVLACEAVRGKVLSTRAGSAEMSSTTLQAAGMTVVVVGSNSEANLASRPVRYLIVDELDAEEFAENALELARQRTKTYASRKILQVSSPSLAEGGVHRQYLLGDRRRLHVPCPGCGRFARLAWGDVKWAGGSKASVEQARTTAAWVCPKCSRRSESGERLGMIRAAVWAPEGQSVEPDGTLIGEPDHASAGSRSYHLSSLAVPRLSWGDLAARFVELRAGEGGYGLRVFVNGELGEPWTQPGDKIDEHELRGLFVPVARGGYEMVPPVLAGREHLLGERTPRLPAEVVALVGFADLQRDRAFVEVRGLTVRAEQSLLVWCGEVACPAGEPRSLHMLDDLVRARWPHVGGAMVPLAAVAMDSGDGARTLEVYQWVMTHPHCYASKGVAGTGMGAQGMTRPWALDLAEYDPAAGERGLKPMHASGEGRQRPGRVRFLTINTAVYKAEAMADLNRGRTDPARGRLRFPAWGERLDEYANHLTSEHLVRRVRPDGRAVLSWELRPGRRDNHHWDTLVGCLALADAMGAAEQLTPEAVAAAMVRWRPEHVGVATRERSDGTGQGREWLGVPSDRWT